MDHDFVVATKPEGKARARTVRGRNGHVHSFTPDATVLKQLEVKAAYQRAFPRDDPHAGPVRMTRRLSSSLRSPGRSGSVSRPFEENGGTSRNRMRTTSSSSSRTL